MGNMQRKPTRFQEKNSKNEWEVLCRMIQENYRIISLSLLFFYRILLFFLVCYRIVKVFVNVILLLAMSSSERTTFSYTYLCISYYSFKVRTGSWISFQTCSKVFLSMLKSFYCFVSDKIWCFLLSCRRGFQALNSINLQVSRETR